MGDPFSIIAGAAGIAAAASQVWKTVRAFKRDYQNAETQICHSRFQQEMLHSHLTHNLLTGNSEFAAAQSSFRRIEQDFPRMPSSDSKNTSKRAKARWAANGRNKANECICQLKDTEISTILNINLETYAQVKAYQREQDLRNKTTDAVTGRILQSLEFIASLPSTVPHPPSSADGYAASVLQWKLPWHNIVTFTISLIVYKVKGHSKCEIRVRGAIPWSTIINFRVACLWSTWPSLSIVPLIRIQNVIPTNSPIVQACEEGDIEAMKGLFASSRCHPNDTTIDGKSLLDLTIRAGRFDATSFLLQLGADPCITSGRWETSPLDIAFIYGQVETARILLKSGADIHYVNKRMWSVANYIFDPHVLNPSSIELLQICEDEHFDGWNVKDAREWTALHRASAFGQGKDVRKLLHMGASLTIVSWPMRWPPIFCAVRYGNESTFNVLVECMTPWSLATMTDLRGWTLLHVAAQAGSEHIINELLKRGLRPDAKSIAHDKALPNELQFLELDPGDVAKAYQTYDIYEKCLHQTLQPPT
ncbi:ankyrin repeat-containing domain protein [Bisporella sp. PMI_857]|nr:ankyrin repeat-containing domain protein [Bisporella sp. PMI_857]